jgi:hypothetical protein
MWSRSQFAKFLLERERGLIKALSEGFKPDEPEPSHAEPPESEPSRKSRFSPGSMEWYRELKPVQPSGVCMNDLLRSIPKPKPPRAPGMQSTQRWNGYYWHY